MNTSHPSAYLIVTHIWPKLGKFGPGKAPAIVLSSLETSLWARGTREYKKKKLHNF
jgi:hypothetical protein